MDPVNAEWKENTVLPQHTNSNMRTEGLKKYLILKGVLIVLENLVNQYIGLGYEPTGLPFNTGRKIIISGDPVYQKFCEYESELAQVMIMKKEEQVTELGW
jgi:hypothetical protein